MTGLTIWHVLHGTAALREWRRWRTADPSLADFYWTELEVELVFAIGFLVVALLFAAAAKRLQKRPDVL